MLRSLYALLHLFAETGAARRDARIRFLKTQIDILRRKLGGNRVIPGPDDRSKLLAIGAELRHDVADVIGIVAPQTYCRWVEERREGRQPRSVGRPPVKKNAIELVKRLARENAGWGYARIVGELRKLRVRLSRTSLKTILRSGGFPPTLHPHERWVEQQTRNVMMWMDDNELKAEFVAHDRDTKFSFAFDRKFYNAGFS
jgi:hypothetical protein